MIVLGIDPGGRWTGIAVMETTRPTRDALIEFMTVTNPYDSVLDPGRDYVLDVRDTARRLVFDHHVELIGCEGLRKPTGFKNGQRDPVNPASLIAVGITYGAVVGSDWPVPLAVVPPGSNGMTLPSSAMPEAIRMKPGGKGGDKHRHERSAFEVALRAPAEAALARRRAGR